MELITLFELLKNFVFYSHQNVRLVVMSSKMKIKNLECSQVFRKPDFVLINSTGPILLKGT